MRTWFQRTPAYNWQIPLVPWVSVIYRFSCNCKFLIILQLLPSNFIPAPSKISSTLQPLIAESNSQANITPIGPTPRRVSFSNDAIDGHPQRVLSPRTSTMLSDKLKSNLSQGGLHEKLYCLTVVYIRKMRKDFHRCLFFLSFAILSPYTFAWVNCHVSQVECKRCIMWLPIKTFTQITCAPVLVVCSCNENQPKSYYQQLMSLFFCHSILILWMNL